MIRCSRWFFRLHLGWMFFFSINGSISLKASQREKRTSPLNQRRELSEKISKKYEGKKRSALNQKATFRPYLDQSIKKKKSLSQNKKRDSSEKKQSQTSLSLDRWMVLGPLPLNTPAFHEEGHKKHSFKDDLLFQQIELNKLDALQGKTHKWLGKTYTWKRNKPATESKHRQLFYRSTRLQTDQYQEYTLRVLTPYPVAIYLNGDRIGKKLTCIPKKPSSQPFHHSRPRSSPTTQQTSSTYPSTKQTYRFYLKKQIDKTLPQQHSSQKTKPEKLDVSLKLIPGRHQLVIKTVHDPTCTSGPSLHTSLYPIKKQKSIHVHQVFKDEKELYSMNVLLHRKKIYQLSISPDGDHLVIWKKRTDKHGETVWTTELYQMPEKKRIQTHQGEKQWIDLRWSPNGQFFSHVIHKKKGTTIWIVNRKTGHSRRLPLITYLKDYQWSPDNKWIIYSKQKKPVWSKNETTGLKRLRGMPDRWPEYRQKKHLYAMTPDGDHHIQLTTGPWTTSLASMRPDGKKILFTRKKPDFHQRPFSYTEIFEMDLETFKIKKLFNKLRGFSQAVYSPKGDQILLTGSPTLFGELGKSPDLAPRIIPNAYDTQAYLYNCNTQKIRAISKTFSPSISEAFWHPVDQTIYFKAMDGVTIQLYRFSPKTNQYKKIPITVDAITHIHFARNMSKIVYIGQSVDQPEKVFALDLTTLKNKVLDFPNQRWFRRIQLGEVKDWDTRFSSGKTIRGRLYMPPTFDPKARYPLIVYYYGGTYPSPRTFDGRYPAHLWAAHGYIVYILQPSGAIGYGQSFSAKHVNEWGTRVTQEIAHSIQHLIKHQPAIDSKRIGCIGASYGGFTTMSLITKSNLCKAAISHAGISNISSYWGSGYWGYLYNSISAAQRYPWTHPQFYVEQSPLYSAHKINTPLLMLHGSKDKNVPPHESFQMYTALRLLQKPVELIVIKDTKHWVLDIKKRALWTNTILAWFERYLKSRPLWWKTLHGMEQH